MMLLFVVIFFFKQKTAYEMRISDWSSDVCSSDLLGEDETLLGLQTALAIFQQHRPVAGENPRLRPDPPVVADIHARLGFSDLTVVVHPVETEGLATLADLAAIQPGEVISAFGVGWKIGSASCRERVCTYV